MAVFKCKMCGGALNVSENQSIATCEYCGTPQTLPKFDDERKISLFTRANHLRFNCEFDKAAGVYESIVTEFPDEAEAYWGLLLCKYGIEYVDDKIGKKIPTCHRTLPTSIMDDEDFSLACDYADSTSKSLYREEAKIIDGIQKKILKIVATEEPYDIFICYKETDDNTGSRTEDSSIAQDIYTELIKEGYKVFFSRVTLREVAGTEYEPYIYAALLSAKVMLAIGTKFEYYDAVWVKNEWSRFISMIGDNPSKALIPCFRDMDAYDMPKEFKNMQALDMGDVTFFASLNANINRLLPKEKVAVKETVAVNTGNTQIEPLLKRAFMFLEDGDFARADEFCEQVLNIEPENGKAYLCKLMAEIGVRKQEQIATAPYPLKGYKNFDKALRFAGQQQKTALLQYADRVLYSCNERKYKEALALINGKIVTKQNYRNAADIFSSIYNFKDANEKKSFCLQKLDEFSLAEKKAEEKAKKNKRRTKRACIFFGAIFVVFCICAGIIIQSISNESFFNDANKIILKKDGTFIATGEYISGGEYDISDWSDIKKISAGNEHIVGLKTDGTVVAAGYSVYGETDVSKWKNIVDISAGSSHTVGLKSDGTVLAVGSTGYGRCDVGDWKDIVAVCAGFEHTVGLKSNGTVVATKNSSHDYGGQCDVYDWTDIVAISTGQFHTVGLKSDGTVVAVGHNYNGCCDVENWTDIVAIATGNEHTVGLKSDGTVVVAGGEFKVNNWKDVVAVYADSYNIVGLKSDGTILWCNTEHKYVSEDYKGEDTVSVLVGSINY